jgi:hypothetical protein
MITFHPIIEACYTEVHKWLSEKKELVEYRTNSAWNRVKKKLTEPSFESAALQYYVLFPAHMAKVSYALKYVVGEESLVKWLQHNSKVTVVDVGCGAGTASVAFVDYLLKLKEGNQVKTQIHLHFIGIDPNRYAIAIYHQQLAYLKSKVDGYGFNITHKLIAESDLRAVNELREELARQRESWSVPFLTHTFLFQANVVSPFSSRYNETELNRLELVELGIPEQILSTSQEMFGKEEATAYKQILENVCIDNLHIITVGTDGYEQRVSELASAIDNEFTGNNHLVKRAKGGEFYAKYSIPEACYWREHKGNEQWEVSFCAEVSSISNVALADEDWQKVQSDQNLRAAWARARHHLLSQTLVDEVEIRLFEAELDSNISHLQQQLMAYAQDVIHTDDRLHFKFPKSETKLRPLGLSRIEEEILSTALIQKLGQRISGIASRSYAYKFSRTYGEYSTEYLYENWFNAYDKYIEDARSASQDTDGCVVIQTDIKSFYTRIVRDNLVQLSTEQLSRSTRVEWLLKVLFARDIDEHEAGKGIVQGNIASGFFANLYLVDLDARFGPGNEWGLDFFRYVDDMIIVVPDPEDIQDVLSELAEQLNNLGLELNHAKTEIFSDIAEFLSATDKNETLDELQSEFQDWLNVLWILDDQLRSVFRKAYNESKSEWWYRIDLYRMCLETIGIYISTTLLSRRIYKYLFNDALCEKDYNWQSKFEIPSLPDTKNDELLCDWSREFEKLNGSWVDKQKEIVKVFQELLIESKVKLDEALEGEDSRSEKYWVRVLRFCVNKLMQTRFYKNEVERVFMEILSTSPWLIRNPHELIENLAIRGYADHIESLFTYYDDETDQTKEYMKSIILRAIRFLPDISDALWTKVVENAVNNSNVVSLMATETWLKVIQKRPELVEEEHLKSVELAIRRKPEPILRLQKNYLLILGERGQEMIIDRESEQDALVQSIRDIIQADEVSSLFNYYEPEILTKEFYSGYRADDGRYHPSPV